jgi:hypothetical protein
MMCPLVLVFRNIILSLVATYGLYIVASLLFFEVSVIQCCTTLIVVD